MAVVKDAFAESLQPFVAENVEPGATVVTDGWPSYSGITDWHWRTGSLEVAATLPSPRVSLSASGRVGISGSAGAESPTSVKENMLADQVFSR